MWTIDGRETDWPKLDSLEAEDVLDYCDGPRLFTILTAEGLQLLVYHCDGDAELDRFLTVPTHNGLIDAIKGNRITLREALTSLPRAWMIDRRVEDGVLTRPRIVDLRKVPDDVLPKEGARLSADTDGGAALGHPG